MNVSTESFNLSASIEIVPYGVFTVEDPEKHFPPPEVAGKKFRAKRAFRLSYLESPQIEE